MRVVLAKLGLVFALLSDEASALSFMELPFADRVNEADVVVLAKVVEQELLSAHYVDDRIRVTIEVVDSLVPATTKKGARLTFLASPPGEQFGDWAYTTGATYLLLLKNFEGNLVSVLISSPMEWLSEPKNKHPAARGETWLRHPGWDFMGILYPRGLPVSLGDDFGAARKCPSPFVDTWSAWFTWEDFKRIEWKKLGADDVIASRLLHRVPCANDAHVPQLIECHSCEGQALTGVNRIKCTSGTAIVVSLQRHGEAFRAQWAGDAMAPRRLGSGAINVFTSLGLAARDTTPVIFSADDPLHSTGWPARLWIAETDFSLRVGPPTRHLWFDRNAAALANAFDPKIRLVLPAKMNGHLHAKIDDTTAYDAEVSCVVE
jgi:hypothetical protein